MSTFYEEEELVEKERMYPELAKANLLRIRGDYSGAIQQCLSILKRFPDDHDTHVLIADIYAEQGDLGQSAQWYELAIDLKPSSKSDRDKLNQLQQRIKDREAASTAQQLGLPPERPPIGLYIGVMGAIAVVVAVGAFLLGRQNTAGTPAKLPSLAAPIEAKSTGGATVVPSGASATGQTVGSLIEEDRLVQQALSGFMPNGTIMMSAMQDPRNRGLVITASIRPEDNERPTAAEIARVALAQYASAPGVIVRLVKYGRLALVASVPRDRLAALDSAGTTDPNQIADAILTEEWSAVNAVTTPPPSASDGSPAP